MARLDDDGKQQMIFDLIAAHQPSAGVSNWTPADLFKNGEKGCWYDPSDFSTMFQNIGGTIPVTAVGQPVARILDKSGNNNVAYQNSTASVPTLQQDSNGKYYLAFDGVDDYLVVNTMLLGSTSKLSLFSGFSKQVNKQWSIVFESSNNSEGYPGTFAFYAGTNNENTYSTRANIGGIAYIDDSPFNAPVTSVIASTIDTSAPSLTNVFTLRVNTVPAAEPVNGTYIQNYSFGDYQLNIGSRYANGYYSLSGRIYSLIIRNTLSTPQEIANTETWVNSKTGAY